MELLRRKLPMDIPIPEFFNNTEDVALKMEWISVKDRFPEEVYCIVYGTTYDPESIVIQAMYKGNGQFVFGEYDHHIEVTHWMPLPSPPEE